MAEEKTTHVDFQGFGSDDMSVLRVLLHNIKGLSPISGTLMPEMVSTNEQFEFEQ